MKYKNLIFDPVSKNNLELIVEIQNQIFPGESAEQNFIETIEKNPYRKELSNWLVFRENKPIGVVGFYSYHEYPQVAWLGWFGLLKEERSKKYGSTMFDFWIDYAKKRNYTEARLYTNKFSNREAMKFYEHKGMIQKEYRNEFESKEVTESTLIFSLSLTEKNVEKWDNKFLELTAQLEKQK